MPDTAAAMAQIARRPRTPDMLTGNHPTTATG